MPKKSSSEVSSITKEGSHAGEQKQVIKSKKTDEIDDIFSSRKRKNPVKDGEQKQVTKSKNKDEIDDIFSSRKRKNAEKEKGDNPGETNDKSKKAKKKKKTTVPKEREGGHESNSKPRRRTNDGLVIYSAEELGFNRQDAGGTPLCPFDCSCCF